MVEIRRILCPIDFSDASRHALEHAVVLARWYGSAITVLHVIPSPRFPQPPILAAFADVVASGPSDRAATEKLMQVWLEPAHQAGVRTYTIVDEGNAATQILEQAISSQVDLIVMGTHGIGGFERFLLGSVTEKVLRKATRPVLTVPPASVTAATIPYKRLLCPVDFSESSLSALRFAFSLAKESDAHLTILHVFEWPADDDVLAQRFDIHAFRHVLEEDATLRLAALVTPDVQQWCKPSTRITHGKPYRDILTEAEAERSDLIVIGVRGRSPLDLTVFGSTTNQVVRRASCPVLTLKQ